MATIYDLNISLDLNNNSNILVDCKQFDDINLIFKIFLDSEAINLKDFDVRLKALKPDETLLIQQGTGVSVADNVLTINASEQLTTTSGKTKIELQFINKITKKKKSTYNIILTVHESIADVDRGISKSAYTLLEEMETKLDQVSDFLTSADEIAKLGNEIKQTVAEGKSVEATLKIDIDNGNALKTNLEKDINDVNTILPDLKDNVSKATELEPKLAQAIKDGGTLKSDLSGKITEGNNTSTSLTQANTTATTTKTSLDESIKKASDLIENNKDIAGLTNTVSKLSNPNLLINGDFQVWQRGATFEGGESGGAKKYIADRWFVYNAIGNWKATRSNDSIKISPDATKDWHCNICQILEDEDTISLRGKTVTFSVNISYQNAKVLQLVIADGETTYGLKDVTEGLNFITVTLPNVAFQKLRFEINFKALSSDKTNDLYIGKCKLEIGDKVTPFITRPYGEELTLCQRYYQTHVASGVANTPRVLGINSRYPTTMRVNPTVILNNVSIHEHGAGGIGAGSDVNGYSALIDRVDYIGTNDKETFTQGKTYNINGLCLDAEIY